MRPQIGMFGYIPTYLIGNLYASRLIESFNKPNDLDPEPFFRALHARFG